MNTNLAILGSGGHSREVADAASLSGWTNIFFFDDSKKSSEIEGDTKDLIKNLKKFDGVIVAIGDNFIRKEKIKLLKAETANLVSIVHPSAVVSADVDLGLASVVFGGVVINSGSSIGEGCILNTSSVITHDCKLGSCVHISPSAVLCGNVQVNDFSWVGANAVIIEGVNVTEPVVIGAGSVVINKIDVKGTYVGNPAKMLI